jgi:hypothetical protein
VVAGLVAKVNITEISRDSQNLVRWCNERKHVVAGAWCLDCQS